MVAPRSELPGAAFEDEAIGFHAGREFATRWHIRGTFATRRPMLLTSWSLGLVGLGLLGALPGALSSGTGGFGIPATSAMSEPRLVELSGGSRLLLARPDNSGQVAVCLGYVVGVATNDRVKRATAIAELEIRRERLDRAYRERFGDESSGSRRLDVVSGDVASLCASASNAKWQAVISLALEAMRPVTLNAQSWSNLVEKWRSRDGLAAMLDEDPLPRQLQTLTWLGVPEATAFIPSALEQSLSVKAEDLNHCVDR